MERYADGQAIEEERTTASTAAAAAYHNLSASPDLNARKTMMRFWTALTKSYAAGVVESVLHHHKRGSKGGSFYYMCIEIQVFKNSRRDGDCYL